MTAVVRALHFWNDSCSKGIHCVNDSRSGMSIQATTDGCTEHIRSSLDKTLDYLLGSRLCKCQAKNWLYHNANTKPQIIPAFRQNVKPEMMRTLLEYSYAWVMYNNTVTGNTPSDILLIQTDRQTDRQLDRQADRQTDRDREGETEI